MQRKANGGEEATSRVSAKTKVAGVKLTSKQHKMIADRAERCGVSISAWMRSVCLQAASRPMSDGYIRIREPDGATI